MSTQVSETSVANLLFGTDLYQVPLYQRDFSWTKEEVDQFWTDVERVSREQEPYFFGSIILVSTDKSTLYEMLDGQQRLAAFTLLLAAARKVFPSEGPWQDFFREGLQRTDIASVFGGGITHRVHLNRRDDEYFAAIVRGQSPPKPERPSHRLIKDAYSYLIENLETFATDPERAYERIQRALTQQLMVIKIVMSDAANAQMIFEAVNSAGLDLSQADLVKNHLLRSVKPETVEHWYGKWEAFVDKVEEAQKTTVQQKTTDFIRSSYISRYKFVRKDRLYKTIRESVGPAADETAEAFLEALDEDATFWHHLHQGGLQVPAMYLDQITRDVEDLRTLNVRLAGPVLLAMRRWADEPKLIAQAVRWLRDFFVRYSVVAGLPSNVIEDRFSEWAIAIRKGGLEAQELHRELRQLALDDEKFGLYFKDFAPRSQQVARTILARLNDHLGTPNVITETIASGGKVHLEHIIPQSREHWEDIIQEFESQGLPYDEIKDNIANLTLLPPSINVEIGNLPFARKRWAYEGKSRPDDSAPASPAPINELLAKFERFGPQEYKRRGEWLAEAAKNVWTLG
jgi:hypothetical protein